ncbi:hypothetical protein HPE56_04115 [Maribacter sp. ANRC-HE7]|uniref:Uncharacterized protein n=1 Tax=Maribacter aquimaris TaxID=2737171 RepID=A0ABR7UWT3_9FLAO|nr:hypothetical protein [Maribacter aquimaris]MBD0776970.1 hypothetical protein [Maribacter aquimaris]
MKNNLSEMMGLDIYLSSLSTDGYHKIEDLVKPQESRIMPLLSWDIYSHDQGNRGYV